MTHLVLFTKSFPFGTKETYVFNELTYLENEFDQILLVPVDYYGPPAEPDYPLDRDRIKICIINERSEEESLIDKVIRNLRCIQVIIREVLNGREPVNHLKRLKYSLIYAKVCYNQAARISVQLGPKRSNTVLYSYWLHGSALTGVFVKKYFHPDLKLISRAHSSDLYHKDWKTIMRRQKVPFMPFEYIKIEGCDKIVSISEHGRQHLLKHFSKFSDKVHVARLGVSESKMSNLITNFQYFRIVTCSGTGPNKRIFHIPEILSHLKSKKVEWVHIGSTVDNLQLLQSEIEKYDVESMCRLIGHKSQEEIRKFYESEQVNLILNISVAEGIPVSIMEAFSYGIPALVTATVGNPEIVDNSCGYVVPIDFIAQEISEKIIVLIENPALQTDMRRAALEKFQKLYNAKTNYEFFSHELKKLAQQ